MSVKLNPLLIKRSIIAFIISSAVIWLLCVITSKKRMITIMMGNISQYLVSGNYSRAGDLVDNLYYYDFINVIEVSYDKFERSEDKKNYFRQGKILSMNVTDKKKSGYIRVVYK